jgi:hypothetical protein
MTQKAKSLIRTALIAGMFGVGFNISQRLLDHVLDIAADQETWLAWLK